MANISCSEELTAYGHRGVCCYGAYVREVFSNYVYPGTTGVSLVLQAFLCREFNRQVEERRCIRKVFWQPAFLILQAMNWNAFFYFVTYIPSIIYNGSWDGFVGPQRGWGGYTLVLFLQYLSVFGNDTAHWCNYILLAFLGLERCYRLKKSAKFSTKMSWYSYFIAIQLAVVHTSVVFAPYYVRKDERGVWLLALKGDGEDILFRRRVMNGGLMEDSLVIGVQLIVYCFYVYICHWLIKSSKDELKTHLELDTTEYKLTVIYVAITSLFVAHSVYAIGDSAFRRAVVIEDDVEACNVYEIMVEVYNFLQHLAEVSTIFMGFAMGAGLLKTGTLRSIADRNSA